MSHRISSNPSMHFILLMTNFNIIVFSPCIFISLQNIIICDKQVKGKSNKVIKIILPKFVIDYVTNYSVGMQCVFSNELKCNIPSTVHSYKNG